MRLSLLRHCSVHLQHLLDLHIDKTFEMCQSPLQRRPCLHSLVIIYQLRYNGPSPAVHLEDQLLPLQGPLVVVDVQSRVTPHLMAQLATRKSGLQMMCGSFTREV